MNWRPGPAAKVAIAVAMILLSAICVGFGLASCGGTVSYQGYGATAVVSADGRTLTVGPYALSCPADVTVVATESATKVALFLQYRIPPHPRTCAPGSGATALRPAQPIRLRAPLGQRRLVDGASGAPTPLMNGALVIKPAHLPDGYRLTEIRPYFTFNMREPACVQIYQKPRSPNALEIVQVSGRPLRVGPDPSRWTAIRVRGRPGRAAPGIITWRERGLIDYVIFAEQGPEGPTALSTRQLIAIANSAHR